MSAGYTEPIASSVPLLGQIADSGSARYHTRDSSASEGNLNGPLASVNAPDITEPYRYTSRFMSQVESCTSWDNVSIRSCAWRAIKMAVSLEKVPIMRIY